VREVVRRLTGRRAEVIADFRASGLSASAFARRKGIPEVTFYYWLGKSVAPPPGLRLARVVAPPAAAQSATLPSRCATPLVIELGAVRVHVPVGCDGTTLTMVVDILGARQPTNAS
jgi:hypothetical protein